MFFHILTMTSRNLKSAILFFNKMSLITLHTRLWLLLEMASLCDTIDLLLIKKENNNKLKADQS